MRITLALLALLAVTLAGSPLSAQEAYPSRPVDFIVTWGTG
jgi:tripartite-type tricarboxylate transporter receptor subunit TctC